uniref:Colony stimulating factor 3 n=1 Tax=Amazona collaria TaxID=241587 RepID=A0A8B9FGR2_9PSIT
MPGQELHRPGRAHTQEETPSWAPCALSPVSVLALLLWAPWQALLGAPLAELSGDPRFHIFLSNNLEFTRKIKRDVAALQHLVCDTFQLCKEEELLLLRQDLSIAQAPMEHCHGRGFQAEACFSQIREGLRTYQSSLDAVLELLPRHAALVESLQLDAANLSSNIQHQVRGAGGQDGHSEDNTSWAAPPESEQQCREGILPLCCALGRPPCSPDPALGQQHERDLELLERV